MAPGAKLEVAGQVKITGGTPVAGEVLTSDATGLATWELPASSGPGGSSFYIYYLNTCPAGWTNYDAQYYEGSGTRHDVCYQCN